MAYKKFGTNVSRVKTYKDTSYEQVVFQTGRSPLDSEFNLFGEIYSEQSPEFLRAKYPSGWLKINELSFTREFANSFLTQEKKSNYLTISPDYSEVNLLSSIPMEVSNNLGPVNWSIILNESGSVFDGATNIPSVSYRAGTEAGLDIVLVQDENHCTSGISIVKVRGLCYVINTDVVFTSLNPGEERTFRVTNTPRSGEIFSWELFSSAELVSSNSLSAPDTGTQYVYTAGLQSGVDILIVRSNKSSTIAGAIVISVGNNTCDGSLMEFALVNGWLVRFRSTLLDEIRNKITLEDAPVNSHEKDVVFLEVWKTLLKPKNLFGKPSTTSIYPDGNLLSGALFLDDEIIDPTLNFETTKRVQLQYSVRVVRNVDITAYPYGLGADNVYSKGPLSVDTGEFGYVFYNQKNSLNNPDSGLWKAKCYNNANIDIATETTLDGYSYAIPIAIVHRRNSSAYEPITNPNGTESSISSLTSDRPDDLRYDEIAHRDVIDTRFMIDFEDLGNILKNTVEDILLNNVETQFGVDFSGNQFGIELTQSDLITDATPAVPYKKLGDFDTTLLVTGTPSLGLVDTFGTFTVFSENNFEQKHLLYYDAVVRVSGNDITLTLPALSDGIFLEYSADNFKALKKDTLAPITGVWTITDTTVNFELTESASGIVIHYSIKTPENTGLTYLPSSVFEVLINGDKGFLVFEEENSTVYNTRIFTSSIFEEFQEYITVYPGPTDTPDISVVERGGLAIYSLYYEVSETDTQNTHDKILDVPPIIDSYNVVNINSVYAVNFPSYIPIETIKFNTPDNLNKYTIDFRNSVYLNPGYILRIDMVIESLVVNISKTSKRIGPYFKTEKLEFDSGSSSLVFNVPANEGRIVGISHTSLFCINSNNLPIYIPTVFIETTTSSDVYELYKIEYDFSKINNPFISITPLDAAEDPYNVPAGFNAQMAVTYEKKFTSTDDIQITYTHKPFQSIKIPSSVKLKVVRTLDQIWASNLGFSDAVTSLSYRNPLYQIPSPDDTYKVSITPDFAGDHLVTNENTLFSSLSPEDGLLKLPLMMDYPFVGKTLDISDLKQDIEGRWYYETVSESFKIYSFFSANSDQWHRNFVPLLCKVVDDSSNSLVVGSLVACLLIDNREDDLFMVDSSSNGFGAALYKIKNSPILK